jgi:predicted nucleic acid-binding protein
VKAAYLDASALVKLFKPERETAAFHEALRDWPVQVSSELIRVESVCTARRLGGGDVLKRALTLLDAVELIPLSPEIVALATGPFTPPLRAMDAIHLATALSMQEDIGAIFVYDSDLHAASLAQGFSAIAPR